MSEFKEYNIKASGAALVALVDKMYQNKLLIPIQEIISNALDIHELTSQTKPIEITIPTENEPQITIRDFGTGLTKTQMGPDYYGTLGFSVNQKHSNTRGKYGLGSKAPLCYSKQYSVESFVNGECTTYNIYLDETEENPLKIIELDTIETNEPNGLKVSWAINPKDLNQTHKYIARYIALNQEEIILTNASELIRIDQNSLNILNKLTKIDNVYMGNRYSVSMPDFLVDNITPIMFNIGGTLYNCPSEYYKQELINEQKLDNEMLPFFKIDHFPNQLFFIINVSPKELNINSSRQFLDIDDHNKDQITKKIYSLLKLLAKKAEQVLHKTDNSIITPEILEELSFFENFKKNRSHFLKDKTYYLDDEKKVSFLLKTSSSETVDTLYLEFNFKNNIDTYEYRSSIRKKSKIEKCVYIKSLEFSDIYEKCIIIDDVENLPQKKITEILIKMNTRDKVFFLSGEPQLIEAIKNNKVFKITMLSDLIKQHEATNVPSTKIKKTKKTSDDFSIKVLKEGLVKKTSYYSNKTYHQEFTKVNLLSKTSIIFYIPCTKEGIRRIPTNKKLEAFEQSSDFSRTFINMIQKIYNIKNPTIAFLTQDEIEKMQSKELSLRNINELSDYIIEDLITFRNPVEFFLIDVINHSYPHLSSFFDTTISIQFVEILENLYSIYAKHPDKFQEYLQNTVLFEEFKKLIPFIELKNNIKNSKNEYFYIYSSTFFSDKEQKTFTTKINNFVKENQLLNEEIIPKETSLNDLKKIINDQYLCLSLMKTSLYNESACLDLLRRLG